MTQVPRPYTEQQITVPWGHIAAKVYGSPGGTRVLMVHGSSDNAGSFERLLQHLPTEPQYVCIDLPGHGISSPFPGGVPLNFFNYVYSVKLVLDNLKWDSCLYIGHSLGGQLGFFYNVMYPGRIRKMVALDGLINYPIEPDEFVSSLKPFYDLDRYAFNGNKMYTKEEILHALQFRRHSVLNSAAAEALFPRAVTKVGNLYRYNRDPRMRRNMCAFLTLEHYKVLVQQHLIPTLLILQNSIYMNHIVSYLESVKETGADFKNFEVVFTTGNHDNHNNNPENISPHICKFLMDDLRSKL